VSGGLRRFAQPAAPQRVAESAESAAEAVERCEMCATVLSERHGHVVELDRRTISCTCRACYLLFTRDGAGGGRYRAVPERYLHDPAHPLTAADWEALRIPVATAFFFTNTDLGRVVAGYPSPGGVTECELDLAAWQDLARTHPLLAAPEPDVEAVFVSDLAAFLVPIDACYALVGQVRRHWHGLTGGDEVRQVLGDFVADLRARSRVLPAIGRLPGDRQRLDRRSARPPGVA
jgi:uncharacterized protein DUF5947